MHNNLVVVVVVEQMQLLQVETLVKRCNRGTVSVIPEHTITPDAGILADAVQHAVVILGHIRRVDVRVLQHLPVLLAQPATLPMVLWLSTEPDAVELA